MALSPVGDKHCKDPGVDPAGRQIGRWDSVLFLAQTRTSPGPRTHALVSSVKRSSLPPRVNTIGCPDRSEGVIDTVQHIVIGNEYLTMNI